MNANLYLAMQQIADARQETDRRSRTTRPRDPHPSLLDRIRNNHGW
jgi:hypothetical protein